MASWKDLPLCDACGKPTGPGYVYYFCQKCNLRICFACHIIAVMKGPIDTMGKCPMCGKEWTSPK